MSSTLSFESDDQNEDEFTVAPYDLHFNDQISGESLVVVKKGETVPCTTKYKRKSQWDYAYKFRLNICNVNMYHSNFSVVLVVT